MKDIKLEEIYIEGFRGFNKRKKFDFNHNTILILGPNGAGKSSLLDAIEFALYGKIKHFRGEEFSKTRDELINTFNEKKTARVELRLRDSIGNKYKIAREKKVGEKGSKVTLFINEEKFPGNSQKKIEVLIKLTLSDFYSCVYLHQGLIRDIIIGTSEQRASALDSLLGLLDMKEIIESFPIHHVYDAMNETANRIDIIEGKKIGVSKALESDLKKLEDEIRERRYRKKISNETVATFCGKIVDKLNLLADTIEVKRRKIRIPKANIKKIKSCLRMIKYYYRYLLKETPTKSKEIKLSIEKIDSFLFLIPTWREALQRVAKETENFVKTYGKKNTIIQRINKVKDKLRQAREENERINRELILLNSGLSMFEESKENKCPLCKTAFERENLIDHIKGEISRLKESDAVKQLVERMSSLEEQRMELEVVVEKLDEIEKETTSLRAEIGKSLMELTQIVKVSLRKTEDPKKVLDQLSRISEKLETIKHKLELEGNTLEKKIRRTLSIVERNIETLNLLSQFLEKKLQLLDIMKIIPEAHEELEQLGQELSELKIYHSKLSTLSEMMAHVRMETARDILEELKPQMNLIYTKLLPHTHYNTLILEIGRGKGRPKKLGYTYMIKALSSKDQSKTYVKTRFSHAQINVTALSIFLALALGAAHNFGAIVIDEPDQSLDREHKRNLADVLRDLQTYYQVIVATQDEDFQKLLLERLSPPEGGSRIIYEFKDWKPIEGPILAAKLTEARKVIA